MLVTVPGENAGQLKASFEQEPAISERPYCGQQDIDITRYMVKMRATVLDELRLLSS